MVLSSLLLQSSLSSCHHRQPGALSLRAAWTLPPHGPALCPYGLNPSYPFHTSYPTQSDQGGSNLCWAGGSSFEVGAKRPPSNMGLGLMQLVQTPVALCSRRNIVSGAPTRWLQNGWKPLFLSWSHLSQMPALWSGFRCLAVGLLACWQSVQCAYLAIKDQMRRAPLPGLLCLLSSSFQELKDCSALLKKLVWRPKEK